MFTSCMTLDDLVTTIPVFPLKGALLLPNGLMPLHIFEERYIRMIDDAMKTHRLIGMIQPDADGLKTVGCLGRIIQFTENQQGSYDIILQGLNRFAVQQELDTVTPYRQCDVSYEQYADDMVEGCDTIQLDRDEFLPLLHAYLSKNDIASDWDMVEQTPCEILLTSIPMVCPFDSVEQQAMLEAETFEKRFEVLNTLIKMALDCNCECGEKKQ